MRKEPSLEHRMADPKVRFRVAIVVVSLAALSWGAVRVAGAPGGPFTARELRDVSSIPVPPPQIEERFVPPTDPLADLADQIEDLSRQVRGVPTGPAAEPGGEE